MQTFLPYQSFVVSAEVLDFKRLNKQVLEASQIYDTLLFGSSWANHPAVKMWRGYEDALTLYWWACWEELATRGTIHSCVAPQINEPPELPHWLGNERLHRSHRCRLLYKDYAHYSQFGWKEKPLDERDYIWPVK